MIGCLNCSLGTFHLTRVFSFSVLPLRIVLEWALLMHFLSSSWTMSSSQPWTLTLVPPCSWQQLPVTVNTCSAHLDRGSQKIIHQCLVDVDCGTSHACSKFMCLQKDIQKVSVSSVCTLSSFPSKLTCSLIVDGLIPTSFNPGPGLWMILYQKEATVKKNYPFGTCGCCLTLNSQLTSRCLVFEQSVFNKQPVGQWPCRWIANSKLLALGKKQWPISRQLHWVVIRSIRYSEGLWCCRSLILKRYAV